MITDYIDPDEHVLSKTTALSYAKHEGRCTITKIHQQKNKYQ